MRLFSLLTASTLALFVSPSFASSPLGTVPSANLVQPYRCVKVDPNIQDKPNCYLIQSKGPSMPFKSLSFLYSARGQPYLQASLPCFEFQVRGVGQRR
ncbi:hypothetical protein AARAC_006204 [Aspergillus arachidicola]|uniref:Uncharacterized protein n=1 Tax=Aspergillus arachidicola TaxID=656916 RepID=A0A2G7G003_9EURO|nr:hypothetical protein AARAC_006204 [Aspergillus arachidicola]